MQERLLIQNIQKKFSERSPLLVRGIGDDCAVFGGSSENKWLISTDLLVENVHFVLDWHDPFLLGRKCIAVNLSDIAAMGAIPQFVLISVSIPTRLDETWLEKWMAGLHDILQEFDCSLIGGDTTSGEILTVNVIVLGRSHENTILYRSSAEPGHDIYVTGELGSSAAGLEILQSGEGLVSNYSGLVSAHLNPAPQVKAGRILAESGFVGAMQDISDGLATDLSHICQQSTTGASLWREKLPFSETLQRYCHEKNLDLYNFMLKGGEDYQLVFTAERSARKTLETLAVSHKLAFCRVGEIHDRSGVFLIDHRGIEKEITYGGFEHKS